MEQNNDYYENYLLDVYEWQLTKKDKDILDAAIYIVDNCCSIRQCSKAVCKSKSQIHRDMQQKLNALSYELYECVLRRFEINKNGR